MRLIVNRQTKAKEPHGAEDNGHKDEGEAELRLVDPLVPAGEVQTNPVVEWARDHLSDDRQDERGQTNQPGLADGEVIRRRNEDHTIDDTEDHDPRQSRPVDEEPPKDGGIPEEDERAGEDLPDGRVGIAPRVDAEGARVGVFGFGGGMGGGVGEVGVLFAGEAQGVVFVREGL